MGCSAAKADYLLKGSDGDCKSGKQAGAAPPKPNSSRALAMQQTREFKNTLLFLAKVELFQRLPKDEHPLLAMACETVDYSEGDVIIKQGDVGSEFFIVKKGQAVVSVNEKRVAVLQYQDYFGEAALLREEPRTATITAGSDVVLLRITRDRFRELGLPDKLQFSNRKAVGVGGARTVEKRPPSPKTQEERDLIATALRGNANLQVMVALDEDRIQNMIDIAWQETVAAGTDVITEGDVNADYFYVVQEGTFDIYIYNKEARSPDHGGLYNHPARSMEQLTRNTSSTIQKVVSEVHKGGSFGELALLYLVPRAATVKARVRSTVWVFDRQNFKSILLKASERRINEYVAYLNHTAVLSPLLVDEKKAVAQAITEVHFKRGEVIFQQGVSMGAMYILCEGEVSMVRDDTEVKRLMVGKELGEARFFGEKSLLCEVESDFTMTLESDTGKALMLERETFNMIVGPLQDTGKEPQSGSRMARSPSMAFGRLSCMAPEPAKRIKKKDLVRVGLLGCGGFGAVELWEHKSSKETYAMKVLSKGYIVQTGMQESIMNEKNILMQTNSPFIIKLLETYNGTQMLYFLLEAALGGELYATYNRKGLHGSEKHAKFYSAGVVCSFEHMHQRRIIYRDLKPENILMNDLGQVKLTDMGLAKFVIGKTYTTCGTPDYFAPELIASTGHTCAVDWWTLGVLLFELMAGHTPFEAPQPMLTYTKVMRGIDKVLFPSKCQGMVGEIIKGLLKKDPSERLPVRPGGIQNLKKADWYASFDWLSFAELSMAPPYKPEVRSKKDLGNFCARKEDSPPLVPYVDDGTGWDEDFASR
eukprot:TRINITY_DN2183_c0_g2_i1.p2 TRINITY_DN2183_c0_g2~~TRINITY_DN2183_c0_g2_i1.p2  ORF type:complete len:818 (+),score=277.01 TRINITY_DN2183_c0_g2_i1:148-2601(+)